MSQAKYKVLEENEHTFLVDDGNGPFLVAKKGLGKDVVTGIQKFAEGGQVEDPGTLGAAAKEGETPFGLAAIGDGIRSGLNAIFPSNVGDKLFAPPVDQGDQTPGASPPPYLMQPNAPQAMPSQPVAPGAGAPAFAPSVPPAGGVGGPSKAENAAAKAIEHEGRARADTANVQAQIEQQKGAELESAAQDFKRRDEELRGRGQALFDDVLNGKIDPKRLWNNADTGTKIAASIGMILGGMGAGMTRGPNYALQVIERAIDRDIDAQKSNLAKKENLLNYNIAQQGQARAGYMLTKADLLDAAAAKLQAASYSLTSKTAQDEAAKSVFQLRENASKVRAEVAHLGAATALARTQVQQANLGMAYTQWMMNAKADLAGGGGGRVNPEALPPEDRARLVEMPNGRQQLAPTPEAAVKIREARTANDEVQALVREAADFRRSKGRVTSANRTDTARGEDLQARLKAAVAKLGGTGEAAKQLMGNIPDPSSFWTNDSTIMARLADLSRMSQSAAESVIANHLQGPAAPVLTPKRAGG